MKNNKEKQIMKQIKNLVNEFNKKNATENISFSIKVGKKTFKTKHYD